jgi:hypothetical protein
VELAVLALQSAMSEIRLIEENDMSPGEIRAYLPAVLDELNKATYYLSNLKNPSAPVQKSLET